MASRNSKKIYVKDGHYHVYNRGVEKRTIFEDEQDYNVFLSYLKEYVLPPSDKPKYVTITFEDTVFKGVPRQPKNYSKDIEILAFCLMPNHFHLVVKQKSGKKLKEFIHSLLLRYSMYFNKRHDRVGPLFQGRFKAVLVNEEPYLLHLSRYIHLNPSEYTKDLESAYSSYSQYLGKMKAAWVKPELVLSYFNKATKDFLRGTNTYKNFVEKSKKDSGEVLGKLTLEEL